MAEYREREWAWMKFVSKEYGLTVNFGTAPQPGVTEQMDRLDDALAEGADITAQVLVRPQALLLSWESRVHPFTQTRMFNEIKQLPLSEWPARLSDMSVRGEMIAQAEELVNEDSMQGRLVRSMFGVNTVTSANDSSFKRPDMDMMTYYYPIVGTCQPQPVTFILSPSTKPQGSSAAQRAGTTSRCRSRASPRSPAPPASPPSRSATTT